MTTNAQHTPGPWSASKDRPRRVTASGVLICNAAIRNMGTAAQNKTGKLIAEAEANARLIAAATELLEAGSALIADVRRRYPGEELRCEYMRALDAAIAKTRGEA